MLIVNPMQVTTAIPAMVDTSEVVDLLQIARNYLAASPSNWTQRIHQHYNGVCSVHALVRAHGGPFNPLAGLNSSVFFRHAVANQALVELYTSLREITGRPWSDGDTAFGQQLHAVVGYNDLGTTTYEDIIHLYDHTLARLRGAARLAS